MSVELYVRSLAGGATRAPQEAAVERLSGLERAGTVDEYAVRVWGRRVCPDGAAAETRAGQFVLDRIERFREWARRNGLSVEAFFDTHEVDRPVTRESYTAITVPSLTLAEFRGDDLHRVTPCADGEAVYTVDDHLGALRADDRPEWDETNGETPTPGAPRIEGTLAPGPDGGEG